LNDYVSPPQRKPVKGAPGPKKFKIPEKGRIRVVLAVLVLTIVIVKFVGPCGGGEKQKIISAVDSINAANGINNSKIVNNKNKSVKKDKADKADKAIQKDTSGNNKVAVDKNTGRNVDVDKANPINTVVNTNNNVNTINTPIYADTKDNQKADDKKSVPNNNMTFVDLRRLVKEYKIGVTAARQQIVIPASDNKGLFNWGKSKDGGDTLSVSLSIDTTMTKYAASIFRQYKPRYAAVAAIDPSNGRVLALASFANDSEELDGSNLYLKNYFPAASVFKTIVAAAAIEKAGMRGKTVLEHFGRNHTLYTTQLQKDLKVSREITLEDAYAYSVNPVFARIALFKINKDIVTAYGRRFGFNEPIPFEYDVDNSEMFAPDTGFSVAEFASGFNRKTTITPIFGALLAGAICENGVINEPTIIDTIRSQRGDSCIYVRKTNIWRRAVKEATAAELRELMAKVTQYGTARATFRQLRDSPKYNSFEFGGKTGSIDQVGLGRVDWFVGFARNPNNKSQRIAVGVVTTHGDYWTVHSSYVAAELIKKYISNVTAATSARATSQPVSKTPQS